MIKEYIISYVLIMICMSIDNIFWIPTSPEYYRFKQLNWFSRKSFGVCPENDNYYFTKLSYIIKYRIGSVLTSWRDIVPALFTSLLLTIAIKLL